MPGRTNYTKRIDRLRAEFKQARGYDPLEYVSRPGNGDPPRYVFSDGEVKLGGPEAWAYLEGLMAEVSRAAE